jgi:hypothetical protein
MSREWKTGDVGQSNYGRVFNTQRGWIFDDESGYPEPEGIAGFRPLVVIDPEDREQVERLNTALLDASAGTYAPSRVAAALRSLLAPPRPPEPQGLGAVVEDAEGGRWVRIEFGGADEPLLSAWRGPVNLEDYSMIDVVRVLSEGVTPDA